MRSRVLVIGCKEKEREEKEEEEKEEEEEEGKEEGRMRRKKRCIGVGGERGGER